MKKIGKPTRTTATTQKYLERADQVLGQIPQSFMANPEAGLNPLEIAEWLKQKAPGIRPNTFRQYKAALVCCMEDMAEDYMAGAITPCTPDGTSFAQTSRNLGRPAG